MPTRNPAPELQFTDQIRSIIDYAVDNPRKVTVDNVERWLTWQSSDRRPVFAEQWFDHVPTSARIRALILCWAWTGPHFPELLVSQDTWLDWFENAPYAVDGKPRPRPTEPIRLYRGCPEAARHNMSWTSDIEVARLFASGKMLGRELRGNVWTVLAQPEDLLAHINERDEAEYVLHPYRIEERGVELLE